MEATTTTETKELTDGVAATDVAVPTWTGDNELRSVGVMLPAEAVVLVGESFSSAMRGKSSPGGCRLRSSEAEEMPPFPLSPKPELFAVGVASKLMLKASAQASSNEELTLAAKAGV